MSDSTVALTRLLDSFRTDAQSEREKGRYFEDLALVYFRRDAKQQSCYEEVWRYGDWARERDRDPSDIGIDLVARVRGEDGFCAIQAKFHAPGRALRKAEVDSFIAASDGAEFVQRAIVDTSGKDFGKKLQSEIDALGRPFTRIRLADLERSSIDWSSLPTAGEIRARDAEQREPKTPRPHQIEAVNDVRSGLEDADRGQLIMACGTGKTFTAQLIAEDRGCGQVLVLVPSLALVSQTVAEWCADAKEAIRAIAVCSDAQVGKRRMSGRDDAIQYDIHDLAFPPTTNAETLAARVAAPVNGEMVAVFSTYQSLDAVAAAQREHDMPDFDLVICDEAHRTTGQIDSDREASNFVRVHDADFLRATKRLYMTATPRIYTDAARSKAKERSTTLCTMDDPEMFGEVLFYRGFDWAIRNDLLSDYRVVVLALDEDQVSASMQSSLAADNELKLSDAVKILGSYKALLKHSVDEQEFADDPEPVRRAMAFSNTIRDSKHIREQFEEVVREYHAAHPGSPVPEWRCKVEHVDGTSGASEREDLLRWLSDDVGNDACHVLSNVRCLGEGVDVPALDAVLFLHPRQSQIDVVQAVGRVMRKAEGKKRGYVILPIGVPAGVAPEEALKDNEKYRVIWQIVNALKSHDERLEAQINATSFGEKMPHDKIRITMGNLSETARADLSSSGAGTRPNPPDGDGEPPQSDPEQTRLDLSGEIAEAIYARMVRRCGASDYWEDWAVDVQRIAKDHITRIQATIDDEQKPECRAVFDRFLAELRDDLNPSISEEQAVEMLAQHLITRPVFDAVFAGHAFTQENSVSRAMQGIVEALDAVNIGKESAALQSFYASVRRRAAEVKTASGKQELIRRLYESFFRKSFGKISEQLGIVFTPVQAVDYILKAVDGVMRREFDFGLGARDVKILDPFVGTGTFLVRLIESGMVAAEDLAHKYRHDLYANEIVPLAYYIAGVNIENAYHARAGEAAYEAFENLCLTDTFQLSEHPGALSELFPRNQERIDRQRDLDFLAIIGNPPYSAGQKSANDNAGNVAYPQLDQRIAETFAKRSGGQGPSNVRNLYDSYVRAIRWASDRIGDRGVIGFITNGGWLDSAAMVGLRRCLCEEFGSLYVLNMRGDARTSGELRRREKDNVFGQGTRTPVAIAVFVKNPAKSERGEIHYHDIGDYLTREQKLSRLAEFASETADVPWGRIEPDAYGDWIRKRDPSFNGFLAMAHRRSTEQAVFRVHSLGLCTKRDVWCYNPSRTELESNVHRSMEFYNRELERYKSSDGTVPVKDFVDTDPTSFSWDDVTLRRFGKHGPIRLTQSALQRSMYRPFSAQWCYFDRSYNARVGQLPSFFPRGDAENRLICTTSVGDKRFAVLMVSMLPDLHLIGGAQCFGRHVYVQDGGGELERHSNITATAVRTFREGYGAAPEEIDGDTLFDYIYGLLHSPDYRERFHANLLKQLPRIPLVKSADDFFAFARAGAALGDLHVGFDTVPPWPALVNGKPFDRAAFPDEALHVTKMRFAGKRGSDRSRVVFNHRIEISEIPGEAYAYDVNGRSPVEWVMERQRVATHKASGIVNDPNRYATETVGDAGYPLQLLLRAMRIGVESASIIAGLPALRLRGE